MGGAQEEHLSLREKVVSEIRRLLAISIYLSIFFLVFRLYTNLILEQLHINYFVYGLTILKALVLAKIILAADALRLGRRFREHPLIVPALYNTVVFSVFALVSEVVEHLIVGALLHGLGPAAVFAEISDKGWSNLAGMTLVVFDGLGSAASCILATRASARVSPSFKVPRQTRISESLPTWGA